MGVSARSPRPRAPVLLSSHYPGRRARGARERLRERTRHGHSGDPSDHRPREAHDQRRRRLAGARRPGQEGQHPVEPHVRLVRGAARGDRESDRDGRPPGRRRPLGQGGQLRGRRRHRGAGRADRRKPSPRSARARPRLHPPPRGARLPDGGGDRGRLPGRRPRARHGLRLPGRRRHREDPPGPARGPARPHPGARGHPALAPADRRARRPGPDLDRQAGRCPQGPAPGAGGRGLRSSGPAPGGAALRRGGRAGGAAGQEAPRQAGGGARGAHAGRQEARLRQGPRAGDGEDRRPLPGAARGPRRRPPRHGAAARARLGSRSRSLHPPGHLRGRQEPDRHLLHEERRRGPGGEARPGGASGRADRRPGRRSHGRRHRPGALRQGPAGGGQGPRRGEPGARPPGDLQGLRRAGPPAPDERGRDEDRHGPPPHHHRGPAVRADRLRDRGGVRGSGRSSTR